MLKKTPKSARAHAQNKAPRRSAADPRPGFTIDVLSREDAAKFASSLVSLVPPQPPTPRLRLIEGNSTHRKQYPMTTGLLDYFPDALAAVSEVSFKGNQKHNPGEPMHHARGKSMDHADCILRHLTERGGFDGDIRHTAALAWRALALLQEELETELGLPLPRGARV